MVRSTVFRGDLMRKLMDHGAKHSAQSRELANANLQLRIGKTRGRKPRALEPDEVEALEARRDELKALIWAATERRPPLVHTLRTARTIAE